MHLFNLASALKDIIPDAAIVEGIRRAKLDKKDTVEKLTNEDAMKYFKVDLIILTDTDILINPSTARIQTQPTKVSPSRKEKKKTPSPPLAQSLQQPTLPPLQQQPPPFLQQQQQSTPVQFPEIPFESNFFGNVEELYTEFSTLSPPSPPPPMPPPPPPQPSTQQHSPPPPHPPAGLAPQTFPPPSATISRNPESTTPPPPPPTLKTSSGVKDITRLIDAAITFNTKTNERLVEAKRKLEEHRCGQPSPRKRARKN